jgi:hypothetical protein
MKKGQQPQRILGHAADLCVERQHLGFDSQ